ncbi:MAG TPA: proton-conducting transporter membrane subunit [Myxococcales bacterium]|jgi:hydrogenase-4 component F
MTSHLLWIAPLLPCVLGLAMLAVRSRRVLAVLDVAGSLGVLALAANIAWQVDRFGPVTSLGVLRADAVSVVFLLLVGLLAVSVSVSSVGWMKSEVGRGHMQEKRLHFYFALVHGFLATMVVTVLADNLGILWIAMEGTTITSALLVGFHGDKLGLEAAWKYIIVTTIGISFGLFGTVLVYGAAVHAQGAVFDGAMNYSSIAAVAGRLDPGIIRIAFVFVVVGYGTKAGLAPVHMWLPDAHSQAPTPVSALLSGALIKCALFGIIRFHTIARASCGPDFSENLLLVFGLISVVVATPFILVQHDLKRLLGYHSVEHVGIVALGLGFGGKIGTYGALLHVINHGVTKALVFLVAGDAIGRYGTRDMRLMKGFLGLATGAGTLLLMGAFSLAGTPPFSIFISELQIVRAGLAAGHWVPVAVLLVMVVTIFAGLIHHVGQIAYGTADASADKSKETGWTLAGMAALAVAMVALGVFMPESLDRVLTRATEIILG